MSSSLSKKELYVLTLAKLKELAKEYVIPGRSTYNASNKNELADKIHAAMKKRAKAAAGQIPVVPVVIDPPAGGELGCDIPQKTCETSTKKYKKPDIVALAKKCGVTNLEGTRQELCARIAQRLGPVPQPVVAPDPQPVVGVELDCNIPQKTCETSTKKYKKPDILALAKKCGVTNLEGTRKDLCVRIAAKMAGMVQPEPVPVVVPEPVPVVVPEPVPVVVPEPVPVVVPEPVPVVVPEPAPVPVGPGCYGGKTYEELIKLKVDELRELMNKADIMKNRPTNKQDMAAYLCAVQQNGRCDPEKGVDCDGDLVCDAQAKVCLDRELAAKRKQEIVQINGKTIVGTPAAIAQLRKKLEAVPAPQPPAPQPPAPQPVEPPYGFVVPPPPAPQPPAPQPVEPPYGFVVPPPPPGPQVVGWGGPQTPDKPPTPDEPPPGPVVPPTPVPPTPVPPAPVPFEKPVHGAEVVDIEEVLRQIQAGGDVGDISALSETQKAVFKCLGLIA
jgi:hypothetical protein